MSELMAIKVRIGLKVVKRRGGKPLAEADYPDFNDASKFPVEARANPETGEPMDWCRYVDQFGSGWLYDKVCGHRDEDETSPRGTHYGALVVPEAFARAALAAYPDRVELLDEAALASFYDTRCTPDHPDALVDVEVLQEIVLMRQLEELGEFTPSPADRERWRRALDPADKSPGRRENERANWARLKASKGWRIKAP